MNPKKGYDCLFNDYKKKREKPHNKNLLYEVASLTLDELAPGKRSDVWLQVETSYIRLSGQIILVIGGSVSRPPIWHEMRVARTEVLGRPQREPPITSLERNLSWRVDCARASHASTRLEQFAYLALVSTLPVRQHIALNFAGNNPCQIRETSHIHDVKQVEHPIRYGYARFVKHIPYESISMKRRRIT